LAWIASLMWAAVIYQLSTAAFGSYFTAWLLHQTLRVLHLTVSARTFATLHLCIRKLAHVTEYAVFSFLLYRAFEGNRPHAWRLRTAFWAVLTAGVYALTDEYHQAFVPGRTASPLDCGIDTLGAALGMLAVFSNQRLLQARDNSPAASSESMPETKNGVAGE
jgi:VanZ family protein